MSSVAVLIVVSVAVGEAKFVERKRKTADLVGCGSVDGLGSLLGEIREAHNAAGPLGIPVAIAKSAGGGAQVHRVLS
jgi:hypothetical protein